MKRINRIRRIFLSTDSVRDVLDAFEHVGVVVFGDTKVPFEKFYEESVLPNLPEERVIQGYTNHETEGYFYFIYDSDLYDYQEVKDEVANFRR